jgi:UDP-N-acetylmuramoyl-L-alanyl-D-glutamate--2,6-diaminopimelate ligase
VTVATRTPTAAPAVAGAAPAAAALVASADDAARAAAAGERPVEIASWLRERLAPGAHLTGDSRAVRAGDGFVAFAGARADGRDFIAPALQAGARAVLWQREGGQWTHGAGVAQRAVSALRRLAGPIAAEYYGCPSTRLDLIAVTGTNGKTSCTQWIAQGLQGAGGKAAVIGTLGSGPVGRLDPFGLTTPDAISLQRMLADFVAQGLSSASVEASSIGLDQGRLDGAQVAAAVFTNLTHDHLDYHGTMARYAAAKSALFGLPGLRAAVVNGDDAVAPMMFAALDAAQSAAGVDARSAGATRRIVFGFRPERAGLRADGVLRIEQLRELSDGLALRLAGDWGSAEVGLKVLGRFNAANVAAVAATWLGLGMPFEQVVAQLGLLRPVRGRMEIVAGHGPRVPLVVVDYAHTPDALDNVLHTLRATASARRGKVWCVFGAGGDRDAAKRPKMGEAAERGADRLVLTSDNPRSETPTRILADIRAGLSREPMLTEPDRALAIRAAIDAADAADVVLIAGKGHEDTQEIGGQRLPFSDVEYAHHALAARAEDDDV